MSEIVAAPALFLLSFLLRVKFVATCLAAAASPSNFRRRALRRLGLRQSRACWNNALDHFGRDLGSEDQCDRLIVSGHTVGSLKVRK